jgi:hypothetical protein
VFNCSLTRDSSDILLELSVFSDLTVPVALEPKRTRDAEFCNTSPTCSNSQNSLSVEGDLQGTDLEGFFVWPWPGGITFARLQ